MSDLALESTAVAHLIYHARLAANLAAAGDVDECASESLLVLTILTVHGVGDADEFLVRDLPTRGVGPASPATQPIVRRRAHALALELQAHFVSEGQSESATLYEALATELRDR